MSNEFYMAQDGVIFEVKSKFKLACCDCGLVHDVYIAGINKDLFLMKVEKDLVETEKIRENENIVIRKGEKDVVTNS